MTNWIIGIPLIPQRYISVFYAHKVAGTGSSLAWDLMKFTDVIFFVWVVQISGYFIHSYALCTSFKMSVLLINLVRFPVKWNKFSYVIVSAERTLQAVNLEDNKQHDCKYELPGRDSQFTLIPRKP
jgi:hypothetical protein